MMRALFLALLLTASTSALAFDSYRAGSVLLTLNDPGMKVLDALGDPRMKEPVFNKYGAQVGEFWFYKQGNKTVKFFISGGRIVTIDEIR